MGDGKWHTTMCAGIAGICLAAAPAARSQESVRPSLTGAAAAEARKPAFHSLPRYNLRAGPVFLDARAAFEAEFNDNINLSAEAPEADIILRPRFTLNAFWQVTPLNALRLDLGLGYAKYLNTEQRETNSVLIAPNSQVAFDIFVGDFRINLHDRFSVQQDPVDEIGLSNVSQFLRFQNAIGLSVLWDLNDVKLVLGYDHYDFKSLTSDFSYLDRSEEQFALSGAFLLTDALTLGLDAGGALVSYQESQNNDATVLQGGPFLEWQFSNYLKLRLSGGFQSIQFEETAPGSGREDFSGPFVTFTVSQRVNQFIQQTLALGYETRLSLTTGAEEIAFLRYQARWQMNRLVSVHADGFCEAASLPLSTVTEEAFRCGAGVGVSCQVTRKLLAGLRYQFSVKDSDLDNRDYAQNRVLLQFDYDF